MTTYGRLPVTFTSGSGPWLQDDQGKSYLDALCGIGVCGLGHSHPAIRDAICAQAGELLHTSNLYGIEQQQKLADRLTALSGMENVFFGNSGAEANEAAIKLARLHGHSKGIDLPTIIVADQSFHGRTLATLSATGNRKVHAGFEPLVPGFLRVPYNDVETISNIAAHRNDIAAILIEPIQGEGGINIPADDYLNQLREICDQQGWLLMLDEIQTGIGRTGKSFAFQHNGIIPDVMTLAKGLGNGVPIGACLAAGDAARLFQPGNHGSTFGGNPLSCRAANAVLDVLESENLNQRATELGARISSAFASKLDGVDGVQEIRHKGLMMAIQLDRPCAPLVGLALEAGLLINVTAESVIRLLPPLILSDAEADTLVERLAPLITDFLAS